VAEAAEAPPLRFIAIFTQHGAVPEYWRPQNAVNGGDFNIDFANSMLQPLNRHKDKLLILDNIDYKVVYEHGVTTGHLAGPATFLTGREFVGSTQAGKAAGGPSLDQAIANMYGAQTPHASLAISAYSPYGGQTEYDTISYRANGTVVNWERDPAAIFNQLFGNFTPPGTVDPEAERQLRRKTNLLTYLSKQTASLEKRLVGLEKDKLQLHLSALESIQRRLGTPSSGGPACVKPSSPPQYNSSQLGDNRKTPELLNLHMDLIAQAFACDLTRVVSLYIKPEPDIPWLNLSVGGRAVTDVHNEIAHMIGLPSQPNREVRLALAKIQQWHAEQIAGLMDRLAEIPEGNGSVLDNTLILWGNELGDPNNHTNLNIPMLLAGGAGGKFRMGRYLKARNDPDPQSSGQGQPLPAAYPHNRLLTSIANAFGIQTNTFGHSAYSGTLPGLT
jgi:hypothetical protein